MSKPPLTLAPGLGRAHERAGDLAVAIKALCYQQGAYLPLSAVLGALWIVQMEMYKEHTE